MAEIVNIDDRQFKFDISLSSGISLTKSSVKYMEINCRRPDTGFSEGVLVIDNTLGALDDVSPFGGDPFSDLIYVYIQALVGEGEEAATPPFERVFSVYSVEDLPIGDWPRSAKRIKFRETGLQALRALKNTVSIEDFPEFDDKDTYLLSNNERSIRSDEYLAKVFEKAGIPVSKDPEYWHRGKCYLPIISPFGNEYLYDCIKKIHTRHIYDERPWDYMYTFWDSENAIMKSIPLSKLFSKYVKDKEWVLEPFMLGFSGRVEGGGGSGPEAARGGSSDLSVIKSMSFRDSSSEELSRKLSANSPVIETKNATRYDTGAGNLLEMWNDYEKFYKKGEWPDNKLKQTPPGVYLNKKLRRNVLLTGDTQISNLQNTTYSKDIESRARLFQTALFNSKKINITVRGMPYRQSGLFADIASIETESSPKHEKMLGRYWVHSCKHIFSYDKYINDITMISP
jgi:hypothetical protein